MEMSPLMTKALFFAVWLHLMDIKFNDWVFAFDGFTIQ
jgi:hypothetical protein